MHRTVRMGKIGAGRTLELGRAGQQATINAILVGTLISSTTFMFFKIVDMVENETVSLPQK